MDSKKPNRRGFLKGGDVAGLSPVGRPIGNFLFLGPTGSGKTRIVEATAESLLKNSRAVIKIDCAEFQHSHEIAKLIGSPPGSFRLPMYLCLWEIVPIETALANSTSACPDCGCEQQTSYPEGFDSAKATERQCNFAMKIDCPSCGRVQKPHNTRAIFLSSIGEMVYMA
jgi:Cdc6-like AAA superfamily ATPase